MVGDEDGNINIYQLKKMNATPEDQVRRVMGPQRDQGLSIRISLLRAIV